MSKKKIRNSNFELMRIVSMMMIVFWHILMHGHVIENSGSESVQLFFQLIEFLLVVHVNSFVLLSGYFQSEQSFKFKKVGNLVGLCWFYRVLILIGLTLLSVWNPTHLEIFEQMFPLDFNFYWFMDLFIFLYCLSPYLNKLIQSFQKKEFQQFLLLLFFLFSIIPYFTGHKAFANNGYTLYNFIFLYFLGAYFKKYPISFSFSKKKQQVLFFFLFLGTGTLNFLLTKGMEHVLSINSLLHEFGSNLITSSLNYSNPLIVIQTISYFFFFKNLSFQNKIINRISLCTLGVYLIHDHPAIRSHLYHWLKIDDRVIDSPRFLLRILVVLGIIFLSGILIEWIRQTITRFLLYLKGLKKNPIEEEPLL